MCFFALYSVVRNSEYDVVPDEIWVLSVGIANGKED
jgi:hypothetical protein